MILTDQAKKLPLSPGVYIWLDKNNKPLYVGRATSLRRRVLQYFRKDIYPAPSRSAALVPGLNPLILEMVGQAKSIKHHKTDTVLEAIILEANLIKKYLPKYNIKDNDDRSFIYIVFPKTDFPKPIIVRGRELKSFLNLSVIPSEPRGDEGSLSANCHSQLDWESSVRSHCLDSRLRGNDKQRFLLRRRNDKTPFVFGPYQSLTVVKNALKIIRRIFPYSTCKIGKPCFDYQIGLCPGVCVGAVSKQDYQKNINNIMLLLRGEKKKLLKKLAKENPIAVSALKHIQDVTLVTREEFSARGGPAFGGNRIEAYDISHFAGKEVYGSMVVFTNGRPDKSQYRLFKIRTVTNNDLEALKEMLERRLKHTEWPRPDLILIDGGKPQVGYMAKVFAQNQANIPFLGISKLAGDQLVFSAGTRNTFKELAGTIKNLLQQARDEAHRFANRGRKMGMKIR